MVLCVTAMLEVSGSIPGVVPQTIIRSFLSINFSVAARSEEVDGDRCFRYRYRDAFGSLIG